jgi:hypothetical protein
LNTYNVTLKYEDRNAGSEGRTIKVDASSIAGAIGKATREFVKGLDRKQRFDMNKGLKIANTPTPWGLSYLFVKLSSRSRSTGILSCKISDEGYGIFKPLCSEFIHVSSQPGLMVPLRYVEHETLRVAVTSKVVD